MQFDTVVLCHPYCHFLLFSFRNSPLCCQSLIADFFPPVKSQNVSIQMRHFATNDEFCYSQPIFQLAAAFNLQTYLMIRTFVPLFFHFIFYPLFVLLSKFVLWLASFLFTLSAGLASADTPQTLWCNWFLHNQLTKSRQVRMIFLCCQNTITNGNV